MGVRRPPASVKPFSDDFRPMRRRGPRSHKAILRRSMPRRCRAPVDTTFGESEVDVSAPFVSPTPQLSPIKSIRTDVDKEAVLIYSINIRCLLSHLAELKFHLNKHRPHIVLIQETWLNESIESVAIRGYRTISRRDRKAGQN